MKVKELLEAKYNFSEDELIVLGYMIHDKGHILELYSRHVSLERVLKRHTTTSQVPLYRGVSKEERDRFLSGKSINQYTSFSEDKEIAKGFGKYVICIKTGGKGFCFWKWMVQDMKEVKAKDPDVYDSIDGDHLTNTATEEKEWIMPFNLTLMCINEADLIFRNML